MTDLIPARPTATVLPVEFDDDTRARLAALDAAAGVEASNHRPANTVRSYAADWKTWQAFTAQIDVPVTAATEGTLCLFVKWLWERERRAASTINRKLAGVVVTLRTEYGVIVNPEDSARARALLKGYKREADAAREEPRGRGKAPAMQLDALQRLVAACPDDVTGLRDRAVLLLGFAIAARRAELAGLTLRDIAAHPNGLRVTVRVTKTEPRTVAVPYGTNPATCPVRAWRAWREAADLTGPDTPAFRRIHRSGAVQDKGLTAQSVGQIITRAGERADVTDAEGTVLRFTGHSVRSGLATEARRAGKDAKAISAVTGHRPNSSVLHGYMQAVDEWSETDNALIGIGL